MSKNQNEKALALIDDYGRSCREMYRIHIDPSKRELGSIFVSEDNAFQLTLTRQELREQAFERVYLSDGEIKTEPINE